MLFYLQYLLKVIMFTKIRLNTRFVTSAMLCFPLFAGANVLDRLGGTWDTMPIDKPICVNDDYHHTIVVSPDKQRVSFKHLKPISGPNGKLYTYSYKVLYSKEDRVMMYYEDERRTTPTGDRIIWELILERPDYYRWREYGSPIEWRNTVVGMKCKK
jgi:hypothetical protein